MVSRLGFYAPAESSGTMWVKFVTHTAKDEQVYVG